MLPAANVKFTPFTEDMKKTHTILIPGMLPMHFSLLQAALVSCGYKAEVLHNTGREVIETGLKYVNNDIRYPALLVIGQLINALESGKYDLEHTALIITQTGGGCRASNYIYLLRKALKKPALRTSLSSASTSTVWSSSPASIWTHLWCISSWLPLFTAIP